MLFLIIWEKFSLECVPIPIKLNSNFKEDLTWNLMVFKSYHPICFDLLCLELYSRIKYYPMQGSFNASPKILPQKTTKP